MPTVQPENYDAQLPRFIDARISLSWLIGGCVSIIVTIATGSAWLSGNYARAAEQMDRVANVVAKLEQRIDTRDNRMAAISTDVNTLRSRTDVHATRLDTIERDLRDLRQRSEP